MNRPIPRIRCSALPNVVVTPHIAWLTTGTFDRSFALAAENCRRLAAGERAAAQGCVMRMYFVVLIIAAASVLALAACGSYPAPYGLYGGRPATQWGGADTCPSC